MPNLSAHKLKKICSEILEAAGAASEEAEISANHLVTSNLMGHDSHGVMRVRPIVQSIREGETKLRTGIKVVKEMPSAMIIDANFGIGLVAAEQAARLVINKAKSSGICLATILNCNFIGRVGHYPQIMTENSMIGLTVCSTLPNVAPIGGIDPILGTNPLSIGIPTDSNPILVDMATSAVAGGKVSLAMARNEEIPLGWIVDAEGRPSTNPHDLRPFYGDRSEKRGALLPFGGHKGYAINLVIEILGRILAEMAPGWSNGVVMEALNVDQFIPIQEFKSKVGNFVNCVKGSRRASGVNEILIPGEPEFRTKSKRLVEGIYVDDANWKALGKTAQELNVDIQKIAKSVI